MALANPKIPFVTLRDAYVTLFRNNMASLNSDLSAGTFTANDQIIPGHPAITPTFNSRYPYIMVKILNNPEEFEQLGHSGRKKPFVGFRIFGMVRDLTGTRDTEIMYLASNMQGLLRDNIQLSTFLYQGSTNADFLYGVLEDKTYVDIYAIDVTGRVEVK